MPPGRRGKPVYVLFVRDALKTVASKCRKDKLKRLLNTRHDINDTKFPRLLLATFNYFIWFHLNSIDREQPA